MNSVTQLVAFCLDGQRYALALTDVVRVVGAAEVTPLPGAPSIVLGMIDVEGSVLPVLNIRRLLHLPEREIRPADQFIIARTARRMVALVVDEALEVIVHPSTDIIDSDQIVSGLEHIRGVIKLHNGLVLICDLDQFLSLDDENVLDEAMLQDAAHGA